MVERTAFRVRRIFLRHVVLAAGISLFAAFGGCGSSSPPQQSAGGPQRYHLTGRVVSVEPSKQQVTVDAGDIPGFMSAMTMGYPVKNPNLLAPLSAEDQITADVVVNGNDMYLENIVVVKKADQAKPPAGNANSTTSPPSK
jgi:Cu/Ag efflux protein CusF